MLQRLLPVLLAALAARAQDAPPAEPDPNVLLSSALQRLKTADFICAAVEVKHEPPEADPNVAQGQGGMGIIVQTGVLGEHPPFEGRVEACRSADGTMVLMSEQELPGFALYVGEERTVERTTIEEDRFSLDQLKGELAALLDPGAFARRILDANLQPTRDAATGTVTFQGKVDRDLVPATGGEMAFMQGRVLGAEATLVVKPDGSLQSAALKITRSDPAREMMRGAGMRRAIRIGGGAGALPPADDDQKHDIVGGSTTYTIAFRGGGMSDRAKAFRQEVERLLELKGHGDPLAPGPGAPERK